jgi:hypothetical protein
VRGNLLDLSGRCRKLMDLSHSLRLDSDWSEAAVAAMSWLKGRFGTLLQIAAQVSISNLTHFVRHGECQAQIAVGLPISTIGELGKSSRLVVWLH